MSRRQCDGATRRPSKAARRRARARLARLNDGSTTRAAAPAESNSLRNFAAFRARADRAAKDGVPW